MFLSVSDFTGKFQLHTGMYDQAKLLSYIERYERKYLVQLFGVDLYNDFMEDLGLGIIPFSPNFKKIYYPFDEQLDFGKILSSEGILDMLKGFIYFEYAKDLINQMTPFGNVAQSSENSTLVTSLNSMMYTRYNESVKTYRAIQEYMLYNSTEPIGQIVDYIMPSTGIGYTSNLVQTLLTGGTGFAMDVEMTLPGGIISDSNVILNPGSGYTNGSSYNCSGGSGTNCVVTVQTNAGVITGFVVDNSGEGYNVADVITILGGNEDATFSPGVVGIGSVKEMTNIKPGNGYTVGDVLTIEGALDEDATIEAVYVGIGDYGKFRGINLQYAYWL